MLVPAITPGPATPLVPFGILASIPQARTARSHERLHVHTVALNVLAGHTATVTGALRPRLRDRRIVLRVLYGRRWHAVAHGRTGRRGRFLLRYAPRGEGSWPAQIRFAGGPSATRAVRRLGLLNSYRPALASWYGGGGGMACGGTLTSQTVGVANKTLPCGTWLTLRYGGRTMRVQVVDRGPYVAGREFDLTEATKRDLGFEGVGTVWATR